MSALILPGDPLPQLNPLLNPSTSTDSTTTNKPKTLRLGPGLTLSHLTPSTPILPYLPGTLHLSTSHKKPTASITSTPRHYNPTPGDPVLVTLLRSTAEHYLVQLTPYTTPALLPFASFIINNAGTTAAVRKSRPNLKEGATIYARVAVVHKHLEAVELAVPGVEFGEVLPAKEKNKDKKVGMQTESTGTTPFVLSVSQIMTKVLMAEDGLGKPLLDGLSGRVGFEMIVGRNGRVWIDAGSQGEVIAVVRCFREYDEGEGWNDADGGVVRVREIVGRVCGK